MALVLWQKRLLVGLSAISDDTRHQTRTDERRDVTRCSLTPEARPLRKPPSFCVQQGAIFPPKLCLSSRQTDKLIKVGSVPEETRGSLRGEAGNRHRKLTGSDITCKLGGARDQARPEVMTECVLLVFRSSSAFVSSLSASRRRKHAPHSGEASRVYRRNTLLFVLLFQSAW